MSKPTLILVTGLPATGKSTLAAILAERLKLPQYGKDQFKEILFDTLGIGDRPWSRRLGVASIVLLFRVIEAELAAGKSCIVESNFNPELDSARLLTLCGKYDIHVVQVVCNTNSHVLLERFRARPRHPGHLDHVVAAELEAQLLSGHTAALALDSMVIEVDTTDFAQVAYAEIERQIRVVLERGKV